MFVLAHLSDLHLAPLPTPRLRELLNKRVLGFLNWQRNRRTVHRAEVLDALLHDLAAMPVDHILCAGDLTNIALEAEFAAAQQLLARLGSPEHVTLVPGNHDAYVRAAAPFPVRYWGDYMRGDGDAPGESRFPFVRRRGAIALVGVSSAVPTAPFMSTGSVGADQLARLSNTLDALAGEGLLRVTAVHHPPVRLPGDRFKRLVDAPAFCDVIARHGADLVLHGHAHVRSLAWIDGPHGKVPVIGVPSASAAERRKGHPAAYNVYNFERRDGGWQVEIITRGLRDGRMGEIGRETLSLRH